MEHLNSPFCSSIAEEGGRGGKKVARGVGGSVITRVHSIHISSVVAVALKVLTKIGTYITIKES